MKKISIIVLNYKNEKDTIECVESISFTYLDQIKLSIIVVNNNRDIHLDQTLFLKYQKLFAVIVINNSKNVGFSEGNNKGIEYALRNNADYILILNNDTIVHKDFLIELYRALESNSQIGIAVPKIYFANGYEFHKDRYKKNELGKVIWYAGGTMDWNNVIGSNIGVDQVDNGQFDSTKETEIATGCCMLLRAEVFKKAGTFDKKYFLYYEDADLSMRVKRAGYKILFVPKAIVWHKNARSSGSGSQLQDYYITRNRLLFGMRYASFRARIALIKESLRFFLCGRKWQKIGVRDFYFGNLNKGRYEND